jgi:hypothetical protein
MNSDSAAKPPPSALISKTPILEQPAGDITAPYSILQHIHCYSVIALQAHIMSELPGYSHTAPVEITASPVAHNGINAT